MMMMDDSLLARACGWSIEMKGRVIEMSGMCGNSVPSRSSEKEWKQPRSQGCGWFERSRESEH